MAFGQMRYIDCNKHTASFISFSPCASALVKIQDLVSLLLFYKKILILYIFKTVFSLWYQYCTFERQKYINGFMFWSHYYSLIVRNAIFKARSYLILAGPLETILLNVRTDVYLYSCTCPPQTAIQIKSMLHGMCFYVYICLDHCLDNQFI